jgi:uncharacterized protein
VIAAVVDTTLLASGFLNPGPPPGRLLAAWRRAWYTLVVSEHILAELARTFRRPYFSHRLSPAQAAANMHLLRQEALITPLTVSVTGVATHPEDDVVLATALSARAQFLVTSDYKFIRLKQYQDVILVSAHEFLALLPGLVNQSG